MRSLSRQVTLVQLAARMFAAFQIRSPVFCVLAIAAMLADGPGTAAVARAQLTDSSTISAERPRVWPASERREPLPLGVVEAFRAPERAAELGVRWQRVLFDWSTIQPRGPQDWQLGWIDEAMARRERQAGRPVVGVLISTPLWAATRGDPRAVPRGLGLPLEDPENTWATWVGAVVGRFAGSVDAWVIWNEPDVWSDGPAAQWSGTPEEYYLLLKTGYLAAKRAAPDARVLMGGLTYWWDAQYGREQYFSRVLAIAAADVTAPGNDWVAAHLAGPVSAPAFVKTCKPSRVGE